MNGRLTSSRLLEIDVLRAVAVLSVVVYHLNASLLPGGFAGVDVFFVISGYVVMRSLAGHADERFMSFMAGFYARRIVRIVPALVVCLVVTTLFVSLFVPFPGLGPEVFATARYAMFGLSNIQLIGSQTGYFARGIELNPYTHTWSLGVEEQFYFVLPALCFLVAKMRPSKSMGFAGAIIPVLTLLSLVMSAIYSWRDAEVAYYSLVSRFWELAVGVLLAIHHGRGKGALSVFVRSDRMRVVVATLLLAAGFWFSGTGHFPFPLALLPVVGTLMMIDRVADPHRMPLRWLIARPVVYIGTISYSLYLWHWPVFAIFRWTVGLETVAKCVAALLLVGLASVLSYHGVERTVQGPWIRPYRRVAIIGAGLLVVVVGTASIAGLHEAAPAISLSQTRDQTIWDGSQVRAADLRKAGCHLEQRTEWLYGDRIIHIERVGCDADATRKTIFVSGDSHAQHYLPMLGRLASENPVDVRLYLKYGCGLFKLGNPFRAKPSCRKFLSAVFESVTRDARPGDILFLPAFRLAPIVDLGPGQRLPNDASEPEAERAARVLAVRDAADLLSPVEAKGVAIVFEGPKPVFFTAPYRCSDWFNRMNETCARGFTVTASFQKADRDAVRTQFDEVAAIVPRVQIWDPFPVLCPGDVCSAFDRGTPLFSDDNHLTGAGNDRLYRSFSTMIGLSPRRSNPS